VADLDPAVVAQGMATMHALIEDALDRMKLARHPEPVIVVGGGSLLVSHAIAGISEVLRPEHYEVANAVGAAIAQVSGEVDKIMSLDEGRERVIERAREEAVANAAANGAAADSVRIVEVEDLPVAYMESSMLRVRVKAVGDLAAEPVTEVR
jgi:hypothetical protein